MSYYVVKGLRQTESLSYVIYIGKKKVDIRAHFNTNTTYHVIMNQRGKKLDLKSLRGHFVPLSCYQSISYDELYLCW